MMMHAGRILLFLALAASGCLAYNAATPFGPTPLVLVRDFTQEEMRSRGDARVTMVTETTKQSLDVAFPCKANKRSPYLHQRRCLNGGILTWTLNGDTIGVVMLDMTKHVGPEAGFALPEVTLELWHTNEAAVAPFASVSSTTPFDYATYGDLKWPSEWRELRSLPVNFRVRLVFHPQIVSSYIYTFEGKIPQEMFDNRVSYDLYPSNNTMGVHFMMKIHPEEDDSAAPNDGSERTRKVSVWAQRKAPVPPFFLQLLVPDYKEPAGEAGNSAGADDDQFGELHVIPHEYSSNSFGMDLELTDAAFEGLRSSKDVTVAVHFFEFPREKTAEAVVPNLRTLLTSLAAGTAVNQVKTHIVPTSVPGLDIRISHQAHTGFFGLHVLQPEPLENVEVSMYTADAKNPKDSARYRVVLRENDAVVPFYSKTSPVQYGWHDAIPGKPSQVTDDAGVDAFDGPVAFVVRFDPISHRHDDQHPIVSSPSALNRGRMLRKWARLMGANVFNVDLDPVFSATGVVGMTAPVLLTGREVHKDSAIATIPYLSMLAHSKIANSTWVAVLRNFSGEHMDHVKDYNMHEDANQFLHFAAIILGHLFEETTNLRTEFETFAQEGPRLPVTYPQEILKLFDFDPAVSHEVKRQDSLWNKEFEVIEKLVQRGAISSSVTREDFIRVRSHLETRLINISEELTLVPIVDLLPHDDHPSVQLRFDDTTNNLELVATRAIEKDSSARRLTIDLGTGVKSPLEFFIQHGIIPDGARKAFHWLHDERIFVVGEDTDPKDTHLIDFLQVKTSRDVCHRVKDSLNVMKHVIPAPTGSSKSRLIMDAVRLAESLRKNNEQVLQTLYDKCEHQRIV